jgi:hypothetical protein
VPANSPSTCKLLTVTHLAQSTIDTRTKPPSWKMAMHHPQGGVGKAGVGPPTAFRIIFSFNTPFCTSAPSKSGCSGDRSQPSLACFRQKETYLSCTCKINHPATGGLNRRLERLEASGEHSATRPRRRPRFLAGMLPLPDPRSRETSK